MVTGADAVAAHLQTAIQAHNAGRLDEAESHYHRILNAQVKNAVVHNNLGLIRLRRGQAGAALPHLHYAIELQPGFSPAHNSLGLALQQLRRNPEAEASFRRAVDADPGNADAWLNLGNLLYELGRRSDAESAYRKVIAINPRHSGAYVNLGNVMRDECRFDEALQVLHQALDIEPKYDFAHNNLGNVLRDLDRLDEAEACYRRAVDLNPRYVRALVNLGTVLDHLGRPSEAAAILRQAIAVDPNYAEAYWNLSTVVKLPTMDPAVEAMQRLYASPRASDRDRMHLAFALSRVYHSDRRYDEAFACLEVGNRLKRATLDFDIRSEASLISRTRGVFTKRLLTTLEPSPLADATPVFIVGMVRSGTTLMEQILASHPDVAGGDELPWMPEIVFGHTVDGRRYPDCVKAMSPEDFGRLGQAYVDRLRGRFGKAPRFITDKLPGNFLLVGMIHLVLPRARIIHMRRHPYDTCLSIYSTLFATHHHYGYDLKELATFYKLYEGLMAHWEDVLPGKVHHQDYEALVRDPEDAIRKILDFCGLPFNESCLRFHETERRVKTASSTQVREGLNTRSIGRWRPYEKHLRVWKSILGEPVAAMGRPDDAAGAAKPAASGGVS